MDNRWWQHKSGICIYFFQELYGVTRMLSLRTPTDANFHFVALLRAHKLCGFKDVMAYCPFIPVSVLSLETLEYFSWFLFIFFSLNKFVDHFLDSYCEHFIKIGKKLRILPIDPHCEIFTLQPPFNDVMTSLNGGCKVKN